MSENVYNRLENFGLKIIAESDIGDGYSFNRMVVFADVETGEMFYAQDSGCSCPSPFEDLTSREGLTALGPQNIEAFEIESRAYFSHQEEFSIRFRVGLRRKAEAAKEAGTGERKTALNEDPRNH
jgi:hypothetical protein